MTYSAGSPVQAADYNSLSADIHKIYADSFPGATTIAQSADYGYGQSIALVTAAVGSSVLASQWETLFQAIKYTGAHQGTTVIPPLPYFMPTAGAAIVAYNTPAMSGALASLGTNRRVVSSGELSPYTGISTYTSVAWSQKLTFIYRVDFGTWNNARYFFNSGGLVFLRPAATDTQWESLMAGMTPVSFSIASTLNLYNLTTTNQLLYRAGSVSANHIDVEAKLVNAAGTDGLIEFTMSMVDLSANTPNGGTTSATVDYVKAASTSVTYPGTVSITAVGADNGWTATGSGIPVYGIVPGTGFVTEGDTVAFTVSTVNVPDGTVLYWKASSVGGTEHTDIADYVAPYTGTVTINGAVGTLSVAVATDNLAEPTEDFTVSLYSDAAYTAVLATSTAILVTNVLINPPAGTLITSACVGVNLVGTYADGNGGTTTAIITANSVACGYVAPVFMPTVTSSFGWTYDFHQPAYERTFGEGTHDGPTTYTLAQTDLPMKIGFSLLGSIVNTWNPFKGGPQTGIYDIYSASNGRLNVAYTDYKNYNTPAGANLTPIFTTGMSSRLDTMTRQTPSEIFVTNNTNTTQQVNLDVVYMNGLHSLLQSTLHRAADDSIVADSGIVNLNFNGTYGSVQYLTVTGTDVIPANSTVYYYFKQTKSDNGDYDYSYGPAGFYSLTSSSAYVAPPAAGTLLSQNCVGFDLVGTYADGSGGTYTGLITADSASCGFNGTPFPTTTVTNNWRYRTPAYQDPGYYDNKSGFWVEGQSWPAGSWQAGYPLVYWQAAAVQYELDDNGTIMSLTLGADKQTMAITLTNTSPAAQRLRLETTFFMEAHTAVTNYLMRADGTVVIQSAPEDFNFNVTYGSRQTRVLLGFDVIPGNSSVSYFARMTTYWNGDYNYSRGPDGFLSLTASFDSWAQDGVFF